MKTPKMFDCEICHEPTPRKTGNQRYCTRCYNTERWKRTITSNRVRRNQKPDNGKPGFAWLRDYILASGRWEPSDVDLRVV